MSYMSVFNKVSGGDVQLVARLGQLIGVKPLLVVVHPLEKSKSSALMRTSASELDKIGFPFTSAQLVSGITVCSISSITTNGVAS